MKHTLTLAISAAFLGLAAVSPAAADEYSCDYDPCTPEIITIFEIVTGDTGHDVPFPSRRGRFISHFDAGGGPRSLVTPVSSHVEETQVEIPCEDHVY